MDRLATGGRFTKGLGALFSVQSIPVFPPKWFSETVPRIINYVMTVVRYIVLVALSTIEISLFKINHIARDLKVSIISS
jgi:hypothetical protein